VSCEVSILGYGVGNTGSIINMYRKLGISAALVATPELVLSARRLILPGVGAFDACVAALEDSGLKPALLEVIRSGTPLLGICVGMQMLTRGSEEGELRGLGLIAATTRRFSQSDSLKVPHMGWDTIRWRDTDHPLAAGLSDGARFYFVHSYYVVCDDPLNSLAACTYGVDFSAAVTAENVCGVQFHPEKSHRFGLQLLRNFAAA
jgi:glutamine amidotransferase